MCVGERKEGKSAMKGRLSFSGTAEASWEKADSQSGWGTLFDLFETGSHENEVRAPLGKLKNVSRSFAYIVARWLDRFSIGSLMRVYMSIFFF